MSTTAPWRCLNCRQLRKHNVSYCCNQPWQHVIDHTYVHQPRQGQGQDEKYTKHWEEDRPWGQTWRSNSPRQRVQSPRQRQGRPKSGNTPRGKSRGRGKGHGSGPPTHKGKGKADAQAPLPPPPMPWPGQIGPMMPPMQAMMNPAMMNPAMMMQPMPTMAMPNVVSTPSSAPSTSAQPGAGMTPEQQERERKMQELMTYLKKRGPDLPKDVSQKVREIAKKDGAQANQDLESAAKALGYAKDELEAALQARTNLVASWKTFLTDAVATWKEYASLFQTQEKEHQERIQAAQEAFATAKTEVDETKAIVGAVIEIKDEEDELDCPPNNVTSEKITESMQFLTQSLQQFQEKAEEIHIEAQTSLKRPRLAPPERMDAAMGATDGQDGAKVSKAMSPFGAAGQP